MAAASFIAHAPRGCWPVAGAGWCRCRAPLPNGGEPAVLHCLLLLYPWTRGARPLGLDAVMRRPEGAERREAERP
jgi:hypothetical protein